MRVEVEIYQPIWEKQFVDIRDELKTALTGVQYLSIEHVGSTSVPGLAAKPVIDIDIVVSRPNLKAATDALTSIGGYEYMGDWGIPDRHAFRKPTCFPTRNLYVCIEGCQALQNHLAVRDICRQDPEVRQIYAAKKLELAQREWVDVDEYCAAKNEVLSWILAKAGMEAGQVDEIRLLNIRLGAPTELR